MLMTVSGSHIDITLVSASTGWIFIIFIVMSGWFLLASAIVQNQRKIKLLNWIKKDSVNLLKKSLLEIFFFLCSDLNAFIFHGKTMQNIHKIWV